MENKISKEKIRKIRWERNLTTNELAEKVMETPAVINDIENGIVEPGEELLIIMAKALQCKKEDFYEDEKYLGICSVCKKKIVDKDDFYILKETGKDAISFYELDNSNNVIFCKNCNNDRLSKLNNKVAVKEKKPSKIIRVINSIVWPTLAVVFMLFMLKDCLEYRLIITLLSLSAFTGFATIILDNTVVADIFREIFFGVVVKFPAIFLEAGIFTIILAPLAFILGLVLYMLIILLLAPVNIIAYVVSLLNLFNKD